MVPSLAIAPVQASCQSGQVGRKQLSVDISQLITLEARREADQIGAIRTVVQRAKDCRSPVVPSEIPIRCSGRHGYRVARA